VADVPPIPTKRHVVALRWGFAVYQHISGMLAAMALLALVCSVAISHSGRTGLFVGYSSVRQRVELLCRGRALPFGSGQLPLSDHVHRLDPRQHNPRAAHRFEAQHRSCDALDRAMILLNDVI
jgi:hypothetical protein